MERTRISKNQRFHTDEKWNIGGKEVVVNYDSQTSEKPVQISANCSIEAPKPKGFKIGDTPPLTSYINVTRRPDGRKGVSMEGDIDDVEVAPLTKEIKAVLDLIYEEA